MKVNAINRWLTLVANFAVFVGIVFLAVEIRQNQATIEESNRINLMQARTIEIEQFNAFRSMVTQDRELARIWFDGLAGEELDSLSQARFYLLCQNIIWISVGSFERSTKLNRPVVAQGTVQIRANSIDASPSFRSCWIRHRQVIRLYGLGEYVDAVENLVKTNLSE